MSEYYQRTNLSSDYRQEAKETCDGYAKKLALIYLVYFAIVIGISIIEMLISGDTSESGFSINIHGLISSSSGSGWIAFVCAGPFTFSLAYIAKKVYEGVEPTIKDLFEGFKVITKSLVIHILEVIFIFLWSLLLIVPGIIKMFAYSMAYYVAIDNPTLTARECLKESQNIMQGHKWEFFSLLFSYIGWILLSGLTLGILLLWVAPRIEQATYLFYLDVSGRGLKS